MSQPVKFEVAIYNSQVRERVEVGEHHKFLKDSWAEINYEQVSARDEKHALAKATSRFPAHKGFVIVGVHELEED